MYLPTVLVMFFGAHICAADDGNGAPAQKPPLSEALADLQDNKTSDSPYPQLTSVPAAGRFLCSQVRQPGFYADEEFDCQVVRHCDLNGVLTSFLCPIQTIFNQITLVCDWYYNVRCKLSSRYYDYSNSRLYHATWPLLDTVIDPSPTGSCPVNPPNSAGVCLIACASDAQCTDGRKCCSTNCGGRICKDPVF